MYSRSLKLVNPAASILKRNEKGIPALFVLNAVSNFLGFTHIKKGFTRCRVQQYLTLGLHIKQ